jgi:small subunit ribosomal protein S7
MPRRRAAIKRDVLPDSKFGSKLITKFTNTVMYDGKKSLAETIVYGALDIIKEEIKDKQPLDVFIEAVNKVRPMLEVKSRRVGGATYQVPIEVKDDRGLSLACRWIISFARTRTGKTMRERLAEELLDAYNNRGAAIKKRDDTHRMAEANKAFAHFRW